MPHATCHAVRCVHACVVNKLMQMSGNTDSNSKFDFLSLSKHLSKAYAEWFCYVCFSIVQEAFDKCDISHTGTLLPKVS